MHCRTRSAGEIAAFMRDDNPFPRAAPADASLARLPSDPPSLSRLPSLPPSSFDHNHAIPTETCEQALVGQHPDSWMLDEDFDAADLLAAADLPLDTWHSHSHIEHCAWHDHANPKRKRPVNGGSPRLFGLGGSSHLNSPLGPSPRPPPHHSSGLAHS